MSEAKTIYDSLNKPLLVERGVSFGFRDRAKKSEAFIIPDGKSRLEFLIESFGITDQPLFEKKYAQVISGSGGAEKDFDALKSSALCALLCFYRIKQLRIGDVTYDTSYFEVKNSVLSKPSNMDVVLTGKDDQGRKAILFLECKFSEYLDNKIETIPGKYFSALGRKYYDAIEQAGLGKYAAVCDRNVYRFFTPRGYSQGTKQVISHLMGLTSFVNRDDDYCKRLYTGRVRPKGREKLYCDQYEVMSFRELLFDFQSADFHATMEAYRDLSNDVRKTLAGFIPNGLSFDEPLTYQELFSFADNHDEIDPIVAAFYGL